ncbi:MAG: SAV_6107 family HEPN domain-containing protein [Dermatophilaceae bacterium]
MSASAVLDLLDRSRESLIDARHEPAVDRRYRIAHLAALRAGAAVLAARSRPARRVRGMVTVWDLIPTLAPELSEWSGVFARCASRREDRVSAREADDLVRDAERFLELVAHALTR